MHDIIALRAAATEALRDYAVRTGQELDDNAARAAANKAAQAEANKN